MICAAYGVGLYTLRSIGEALISNILYSYLTSLFVRYDVRNFDSKVLATVDVKNIGPIFMDAIGRKILLEGPYGLKFSCSPEHSVHFCSLRSWYKPLSYKREAFGYDLCDCVFIFY